MKWIKGLPQKIQFCVLLLMPFLFISCSNGGKYKIIMGGIHSTNQSIDGTYKSFSGYYYQTVRLKASDHLDVRFDSQTRKGSLIAELQNKDGQVIYKSNPGKNTDQIISIPKTGRYRMEVIGSDHSGSFNLRWNTR